MHLSSWRAKIARSLFVGRISGDKLLSPLAVTVRDSRGRGYSLLLPFISAPEGAREALRGKFWGKK